MASDPDMPSLSSYLTHVRRAVFPGSPSAAATARSHKPITLILGNPSADLDSFISAIVLSYFYNYRSKGSRSEKSMSSDYDRIHYVPLLNLPSVRSNELWRLRPEFGVALRLALGHSTGEISSADETQRGKVAELEQVLTIADLVHDSNEGSELPSSPELGSFHTLFSPKGPHPKTEGPVQSQKQNLLLVDHNAPSIPGLDESAIRSRFAITGVVDHHVDEDYISKDANPRIVTTGIGSCTSLVVQHLRDQGLWPASQPSSQSSKHLQQISRLALAPILIDTSNLRATGDKCSDVDREAVRFLESFISTPTATTLTTQTPSNTANISSTSWNRDTFHSIISTTKSNSLNLLNTQETFDRDYKSWTETPNSKSNDINIGISSLVKPLSWLVAHSPKSSVSSFIDEIQTFANDNDRRLGVFTMLTRRGDGKEVIMVVLDERGKGLVEEFEKRGGEDLKLRAWRDDEQKGVVAEFKKAFVEVGIWDMRDTSKSRKQVAPLLRECVKSL